MLSIAPEAVSKQIKSGGSLLQRPVSSGSQDFDTDRNLWPLNKPIPKIEALLQCAGSFNCFYQIKFILMFYFYFILLFISFFLRRS